MDLGLRDAATAITGGTKGMGRAASEAFARALRRGAFGRWHGCGMDDASGRKRTELSAEANPCCPGLG
jgi:hypothetical protein